MQHIYEGAVFIDRQRIITCWNRAAELITGLTSANTLGLEFTPSLIGLIPIDEKAQGKCPVAQCLSTKQSVAWPCKLTGRSGREAKIELTVVPVVHGGQCFGCVILIYDVSVNAELKRQLSELHDTSALDPLTRIANRAEFDRGLREYVFAHRATQSKCCLIVCDIDHFKKINDTYGHNVGDQALMAFAQTLKRFIRSRDLVARYGGEEFVILCANCELDNALDRAEQIRICLNQTPQQMLDGKSLSASFGVSELRVDEGATEFFVRADKALYAAKNKGRNRVERASDRDDDTPPEQPNCERSAVSGVVWPKVPDQALFQEEYRTTTPATMLAEKLRGYVLESQAKIEFVEPNRLAIQIPVADPQRPSRKSQFRVIVDYHQISNKSGRVPETFVRLNIYRGKKIGMFGRHHDELHARLVTEIRRFLMITDDKSVLKLNSATG
jgi:diguanylate cyclase (GGDEF)-like protein